MSTEENNKTITLDDTNTWTTHIAQEFSDKDNHMVNIDDLISQWSPNSQDTQSIASLSDIPTNHNTEGSNLWKLKIIWASAGILLLMVVSWTFVYMMYPIEFENFGKSLQWDAINWWVNTWIINTGRDIDNKNAISNPVVTLSEPQLDTWSKNNIDNLFAGKWSGDAIIDNKLESDDPNKLMQNVDWSTWLTNDSNILEWLSTGNYWNGDENGKIELLWQIRAKIEIAKLTYNEAKKSWNKDSMKLIASSLSKYKKLLTQVENNEIIVKLEIQDKLVEIQADVDKAEMLIQ
jgi:hypothetical protein